MKHLSYLNKYFIKYKWHFLLGILFVTISNIFGVLPPIVIRHAFNLVKENIAFYHLYENFGLEGNLSIIFNEGLLLFGAAVLGLAIMKGLFMFFMRQTLIVMSRHIEYDLRNEIYDHYQQLDLAFYKRNKTGDLMSRVAEDVSRVRMYIGPAIMYAMNTLVLFIMVITVMVNVNARLTMYVLIPLPVLSLSIYYVNNLINKKSEAIQKQLSFLTTVAQEVYSGIRVIKSYVQEKTYSRFFGQESEEYKEKSLDLARVEAMFFPLMLLLIGLSTILTIYVGGIGVIDGEITTGNIAEFVIYVNMLTWPVTSIGWVASIIQRAAASQKRINEFLNTSPAILDEGGKEIPLKGGITFDHVNFIYPDTGVEALKNVSFHLKAGEKMAIIGRTGSGKSTIADLLLRLYDPMEGRILADGHDIRKLALGHYRKQLGFVPQDVFLFSNTIANNIAFGSNGADIDLGTIREMAGYAAIHEEIAELPKAYDTLVGERGVTLSGGQKQRVSIARAFLKNPNLLILDDCLSAVDAKTEKHILNSLNQVLKDKTAIIITHRIHSLLDFDKIIVLENGMIAEEGKHAGLMKQKGLYYQFYQKQKMEENFM